MDMFRKICSFMLVSVIAFSCLIFAASADQKPGFIVAPDTIGSPVPLPAYVQDCPKCRLQHQPIKELIQPIKEAVSNSPLVQAIKYDAKLDGEAFEECKSCRPEVKPAGPKTIKLRNGRVHLRLGGRRCCHSC